MKILDNEKLIHEIHLEDGKYWVLSQCFKVDLKSRSTTGITTADFGPFDSQENAIESIRAFDPTSKIIDFASPKSLIKPVKQIEAPKKKKKGRKNAR